MRGSYIRLFMDYACRIAVSLFVMGDTGHDALRAATAVVRCALSASGWGSVLRFVRTEHRQVVRAFEEVVLPLVEQAVPESDVQRTVHTSLLATSMKVGLAMWGYASMARVPFDAELAVLGSSFTRLYDDLIDNFERENLGSDLLALLTGEPFRPCGQLEELLALLYKAIVVRLPHEPGDPIYGVLRELHDFQLTSRLQQGSGLSVAEVLDITRGKGGLAMIALFALLRPVMPAEERDILMDLGDVFQLLDDFHDLALDEAAHVTTSVTLGVTSVVELVGRISRLRSRFIGYYGTAGPLSAQVALTLIGVPFAGRRGRRAGRGLGPDAAAVRLLFSRAENIRP
ncbi:isoprenoid biosynthesis enzyme family protein [Streptomyces cavernicola]|uniref:Uncharacterized protein n=1 Tax=Streptomyces cavernicola TaxID=3043613 RepID=A0ABT6SBB3_9ACTN|nr:hypothetical protein [Streptomyces sp. B-S-A6]MDI3404591.1 hypothetical protein [Streptomyces sp. B-S-A6]